MKDLQRTTDEIECIVTWLLIGRVSNVTNEDKKKYGKLIGYDINGNAVYENPEYKDKKAKPIHDLIFGRRLNKKL
jgi:hypothetical protein